MQKDYHNRNMTDMSLAYVPRVKYFGTTLKNRNSIRK